MEQSRASASASRVPARRSRGRGLLVRLAAAVLAVGPAMTLQAVPAAAAECTTESGVTVVVDFGGSVQRGCAPGDPASGFEALSWAGFTVDVVQRNPGAICRINGTPSDVSCVRMPPANAYWSYWRAQPGGSWNYSNDGVTATNPAPGTIEGWAFGAGTPPSTPPPSVPAPPAPEPTPDDPPATADDPTPTHDDPPPSRDTPTVTSGGGATDQSGDGGGDSSSGGSGTSGTDDSVADRTSEGSTTPEESTSSSSSRDSENEASESTSPSSSSTSSRPSTAGTTADAALNAETIAAERTSTDGGSSAGLWTGLALVLALAGAGGWVAWRRRDGSV